MYFAVRYSVFEKVSTIVLLDVFMVKSVGTAGFSPVITPINCLTSTKSLLAGAASKIREVLLTEYVLVVWCTPLIVTKRWFSSNGASANVNVNVDVGTGGDDVPVEDADNN